MTDNSRLRELARDILDRHIEDAEFCLVYEDEVTEDLTYDEMREVYRLIVNSTGVLPSA